MMNEKSSSNFPHVACLILTVMTESWVIRDDRGRVLSRRRAIIQDFETGVNKISFMGFKLQKYTDFALPR